MSVALEFVSSENFSSYLVAQNGQIMLFHWLTHHFTLYKAPQKKEKKLEKPSVMPRCIDYVRLSCDATVWGRECWDNAVSI